MSEFTHIPVLARETLAALAPRPGGLYVDCTLGGGGHTEMILDASSPDGRVLGLDRDPNARDAASMRLERFSDRVTVFAGPFSAFAGALDATSFGRSVDGRRLVDGVLADIGVSSPQFDLPERGFSFREDGPLDMRMGDQGPTADEWIEAASESELTRALKVYGEIGDAHRYARAIKTDHAAGKIRGTHDLAGICERVARAGKKQRKHHPATQVFQALRIAVNDELGELDSLLEIVPAHLDVGGVFAVISFHSLEDRRVKRAFRDLTTVQAPRRLPIPASELEPTFELTVRSARATEDELATNVRARSATLRAVRRIRFEEGKP